MKNKSLTARSGIAKLVEETGQMMRSIFVYLLRKFRNNCRYFESAGSSLFRIFLLNSFYFKKMSIENGLICIFIAKVLKGQQVLDEKPRACQT